MIYYSDLLLLVCLIVQLEQRELVEMNPDQV